MIKKKSATQKAIENSNVSKAAQAALEDLFAEAFSHCWDFETDIQGTALTIKDLFIKFCEQEFDSYQHRYAVEYGLRIDASLTPAGRRKLYFERELLKTGKFNGYDYLPLQGYMYLAVEFNGVQTSKGTGKPCDVYFIELRQHNRFINSWVVKDYPQDHDPYHRYATKP